MRRLSLSLLLHVLALLVFLKTLKRTKSFRSPKGSMRYLSLVAMANKLVSAEFLSFFFSALKVLVSLYLFHWPAPSNFAIFQNSLLFLFPSRSFLKSIIHPGPLVCLLLYYTIPVAMTCHELAGLLSSFFQMFACASHVILLMLFCCIASR